MTEPRRGVNRKATLWAWEQPLAGSSKLVLLALAILARGPEHRVNLSATATVDELAQLTGLGRRTVRTHLRALEASEHVVAEQRIDVTGARLANRWHLNVDGLAPVALAVPTVWKDDTWQSSTRDRGLEPSPQPPASTSTQQELPGMPTSSAATS